MAEPGQEDLVEFAKRPVYAPINDKYLVMYKDRQSVPVTEDSKQDLFDRDYHTIQYTKAQLSEGDTLVFIKFPNNEPVYHPTGFQLRTQHVVHYEKLVGCGSQSIISMLDSREQQLRLQRRFGLVGRLPEGIKYLLDLTPPGEGDEAVALTVLLSCPLGVRRWYTSVERCKVSRSLVGGRDEITYPDLIEERSRVVITVYPERDPEEYCEIRHRTGIERLLQVIEGKDPRLDSAPKVWTLVMLAHYFGCAKVVEDHVLSWLLAEPNNRFIEILPEAALKIGIVLENEYVVKYAFSVLVSEKALALGSGNFYRDFYLEGFASMMGKNKSFTRLGRPVADVDEDWTNMVQYAAQAFAARIHHQVRDLLGEEVTWIRELPEYRRILDFEQFLAEGAEIINHNACVKLLHSVEHLHMVIRDFVRGMLFRCLLAHLAPHVEERLHTNRVNENHLGVPDWHFKEIYNSLNDQEKVFTRQFWENVQQAGWSANARDNPGFESSKAGSLQNYYDIPFEISSKVRHVKLDQVVSAGRTLNIAIHTAIEKMGYNGGILPDEAYVKYSIKPTTKASCSTAIDGDASTSSAWIDPTSAESHWTNYENEPVLTHGMENLSMSKSKRHVAFQAVTTPETHISASFKAGSKKYADFDFVFPSNAKIVPKATSPITYTSLIENGMFPSDDFISTTSPFINVTRLFAQIYDYLCNMSSENLSRNEFSTSTCCDTLLSLSEKEFAFLPLWAGGLNDGSGGVFTTEIPLAERGAPSEPGPSYHTGSTLNSVASSEVDFDGESFLFVGGSGISQSGDTSMAVENGEDDHLGRGVVVSEEEFPMQYDLPIRGTASTSVVVTESADVPLQAVKPPHVPSFIEDENFFNTPGEDEDEDEEEEKDEDEDDSWDIMDDDDDDGEDTETED